MDSAETKFEANSDVNSGGVLIALPALLANGLLAQIKQIFTFPQGYYRMHDLFILIGLVVLLRIKTIEGIKQLEPGEFGNLLGLDRIPEIQTIRSKIAFMSELKKSGEWSSELSKNWFSEDNEYSGIAYIDGHVRIYYGSQTKLPRRYSSRLRLCMPGITDYWVNDVLGRPFFYTSSVVNNGLIAVMKSEIIPRLKKEIPNQPSDSELEIKKKLSRFTIVFDREGYSPEFIYDLFRKERISCVTYKKYADEAWPEKEFQKITVQMPHGENIIMKLAERELKLGEFKQKDEPADIFIVREIRKLTETGHQTSIITSDYISDMGRLAAVMFSRWSQENFFKYMMQHFGIDRVMEIGIEDVPATKKIVNPEYKKYERMIRTQNAVLFQKLNRLGEISMEGEPADPKKLEKYIMNKSKISEEIENIKKLLVDLKEKKKNTEKNILVSELPDTEKFSKLVQEKKHILDLIKMIAYRAETALASIIKENMKTTDKEEARSLLQNLYKANVDIFPDYRNKKLYISVHNLSNESFDKHARYLFKYLNDSNTVFPNTNLQLVYKLVTDEFPLS